MPTTSYSDQPRLLAYLPAIFQEQAAHDGDPLHAVLSIFEELIASIEVQVENTVKELDPNAARAEPKNDADFLTWLASWVDLPLDDEWDRGEKTTLNRKKRYFIKNAAALYRYRGTSVGLKYMLGAFYNVDVDVLEWTWPRGIRIGTASAIGIESLIIDPPPYTNSLVVVWRTDEPVERLARSGIDFFPVELANKPMGRTLLMPILKGTGTVIEDKFVRKFHKLRHQINHEKPAHTHCYLLIEGQPIEPEAVALSAMEIGLHSTIEWCRIEE